MLLGNGNGGFGTATTYAAGSSPNSVTTADVNGDGRADLVVADYNGGVAVLLGNGSGGFGAATTYTAGPNPDSVTTADVNGDGKVDLVVADNRGGVAVLLGDGGGGFAAATTYAAGPGPVSITTTDVDGDGKPDLVVAGASGVSVLPNSSTSPATFDPASAGTASGHDTGLTVACYGPATLISTERGPVAVASLAVGDRCRTAQGSLRPVVWIGHRAVDLARHPRPWNVMPVRVQANAFGPGLPTRDLVLSPDHAVYAEGVLIPVRYLLNGASIRQEAAARITWWHVELDAHDLILAEGMPTESYLDTGNRSAFANGGGVTQAHPDFSRDTWASDACAELAMSGRAVRRVRAGPLDRLAALGHPTTDDPDLRIMAGDARLETQACGDRVCVVAPDGGGPEAGAGTLRLASRSACPAELAAASDDCRRLGVALLAWSVDGEAMALDDPRLGRGWHCPEPGLRWIDGDATLAVPPGSVVELRLGGALRFHLPAPAVMAADDTPRPRPMRAAG